MQLLLLQLLALLLLGKAAERGSDQQSQSSPSLLLQRNGRGHPEEAEEKPDLFVAMPHLLGADPASDSQRQREKMLSRFGRFWKKPERDPSSFPEGMSVHFPPRTQAHTRPLPGEQMKSPLREEAKKFWYHFLFRRSPASQGVILPIKGHEVHQEACRTVPFTQTITHEDCEEVTVQNHLCFGKCASVQFPGVAQHPDAFCFHCAPAKFTTMHLQLNCTDIAPVVKVVMVVEQCQCTVKTEHEHGHLLQAGSQVSAHAQDPFIPGFGKDSST